MQSINSNAYLVTVQNLASNNESSVQSSKALVTAALSNNVQLKSIEDQISGFSQSSQILIHVLDDVAKIHPFVGSNALIL